MAYRVIATKIVDDTDRVVFDALDNKIIRRELCRRWNEAEAAEAERDEYKRLIESDSVMTEAVKTICTLRRQLAEAQGEIERMKKNDGKFHACLDQALNEGDGVYRP